MPTLSLFRIIAPIIAAVAHGIAIPSAQAADTVSGASPIAWTCVQMLDAAYHVVCRPSRPPAHRELASDAPAPRTVAATVPAVWGSSSVFRSSRPSATESESAEADDSAKSRIRAAEARSVSHTTHRGASHLVPIAERSASEIFTGKPWNVPLHARPTDAASVARLLREVLCGSAPCAIQYSTAQQASVARF